MLWYVKPGEPPKADTILTRMSEAGVCLLSGEMDDVLSIPVDFNTNNMLPTNMANISKSLIENITHTISYKFHCPDGVTVVLNTPPSFIEYNQTLLGAIELPQPKHFNFIEIYEYLMSRHVKGISKIRFEEGDSCMDWIQLQRYWFTQLDKMKTKKPKITVVN